MIEVRDLWFRYPGAPQDTLRGLGFAVGPGEVFGLLGPSGTGKSTVVGVLTGALHGYRGTVRILGDDGAADRARRSRIGVGFEVPSLYSRLTARENLDLFAALHGVPLLDVDARLAPLGLEDHADQRVEAFSKGMKSRLDLCRALLSDPDLLFVDEPTAALDPGHARVVRDLLRAFADRGGAVLLTTHDMQVAEAICDRVGLLIDGRFAATGPPRALRARSEPPTIRVEASSGAIREVPLLALADDEALRQAIREGHVRSLHTCEPTLEDVFVELTGRTLT